MHGDDESADPRGAGGHAPKTIRFQLLKIFDKMKCNKMIRQFNEDNSVTRKYYPRA